MKSQDFEYTIWGRLMRRRGAAQRTAGKSPKVDFHLVELDEHLAGKSKDLDALAVYTNSFMRFTALSPAHPSLPGRSVAAFLPRGKKLFFSEAVGCAGRHSGPYYTDSKLEKPFNLHDVGTFDPMEKMGPKYDTPTLLGVYRTAPLFASRQGEDTQGRADDLQQGRQARQNESIEGRTRSTIRWSSSLKGLPFYETPPSETPNTVKYRHYVHAGQGMKDE